MTERALVAYSYMVRQSVIKWEYTYDRLQLVYLRLTFITGISNCRFSDSSFYGCNIVEIISNGHNHAFNSYTLIIRPL